MFAKTLWNSILYEAKKSSDLLSPSFKTGLIEPIRRKTKINEKIIANVLKKFYFSFIHFLAPY